ncbi:MAG: aspartyl/asparaginyl beta-hydroxylase domain-containing protein [Sphingomonadales bacterium]|nr:aspartyl/asparaginyl beta-hydroxylase domain-containing protein [Sphingomonadales bacterium]MBD3773186.1 aspartyl/asparaginyl beta-hydroxylase domain-containing protein [Paracoccaceae bacterium]
MLAKADNRMLAGDHRAANAYYGQVGRLAGEGEPLARDELLRARDATLWLADRFRDQMLGALDAAGFPASQWHPRFRKSIEIMLGHRQRDPEYVQYPQLPMTYFYPDTDYCTFASSEGYEWRETLRSKTDAIRQEGLALIGEEGSFRAYVQRDTSRPQGDVHGLVDNDEWSTCYLTDKGAPIAERTTRNPATWAALQQDVPLCDITARAPSVMFSLLRPGAKIPPHTGMLNTRFICHLPLIIPPDCGFRVGGDTRQWDVGELMVFDDTVEHEAWNHSPENRLLLIFDVWRPEITLEERAQIRALFEAVDAY